MDDLRSIAIRQRRRTYAPPADSILSAISGRHKPMAAQSDRRGLAIWRRLRRVAAVDRCDARATRSVEHSMQVVHIKAGEQPWSQPAGSWSGEVSAWSW